eukprot:359746-Chlamydomonas_euryale.AAC.3
MILFSDYGTPVVAACASSAGARMWTRVHEVLLHAHTAALLVAGVQAGREHERVRRCPRARRRDHLPALWKKHIEGAVVAEVVAAVVLHWKALPCDDLLHKDKTCGVQTDVLEPLGAVLGARQGPREWVDTVFCASPLGAKPRKQAAAGPASRLDDLLHVQQGQGGLGDECNRGRGDWAVSATGSGGTGRPILMHPALTESSGFQLCKMAKVKRGLEGALRKGARLDALSSRGAMQRHPNNHQLPGTPEPGSS